ncbi:YjcZ family sporulation protein (plasmid) [Priestia megaterium]
MKSSDSISSYGGCFAILIVLVILLVIIG